MAEDPNTPSQNSEGPVTSNQIQMARELNAIFNQVADRIEQIRSATQNQADIISNMTSSFQSMYESTENIYNSASEVSRNLGQIAESSMNSLGQSTFDAINQSLEGVAKTASDSIESHQKNLEDLEKGVSKTGNLSEDIGSTLTASSGKFQENAAGYSRESSNVSRNAASVEKSSKSLIETLKELGASIKSMFSTFGNIMSNVGGGILKFGKMIVSGVTTLVGAAAKFVKFSITVPFTIAQAAAEMGNKIRTDLVETIQSAAEETKQSFDFSSHIGKGIQQMTARGKGMLLAFQNPSSEMVKLFGYGAAGIANMIKEVSTNVAAMGHFSEIFGRSIFGNHRRMKDFTKMVKGFGFTSEDIHYLALDASTNLEHINTRMARLGVTLSSVSTEFGVDRKRLAKNFMVLRKDITQFGHLSDEEIAKTTARLTQMRVKLEDAAAVFKKFSTFEDAANSVAILSQTFGMNLDAFDMIQAQNPEEIIDMFRNSMLETGRSFEDLNRFEKDLMAQHTGMTAESLAALMNYRDLGLTHEEAVKKMASERPEAKQMAALKKLNGAIKEVQKVLTFDSPFQAFADGLMANTSLSGDLKETLISLSGGYQSIFEYAKGLDSTTWTGLTRPIKLIIDIMRGIFQSEAFKDGLVNTVKVIGNFVANMFGVSNPDRALSEIEKQMKTQTSAGGALEKNKKNEGFRKTITDLYKDVSKSNLDAFSGIEDFEKKWNAASSPEEVLQMFRAMQKAAVNDKNLMPYFNSITDDLKKKFKGINFEDKNLTEKQQDAVDLLVKGLEEVATANQGNLGKLATLSTRIMGAVIKGAGIAMTAILKVTNMGIDKAEKAMKDKGEDVNLIEKFFHFNKGELEQLGKGLNEAITEFFSKSSGVGSLTGWLLTGLKDIFSEVLGFFGSILASGIDEIFGTSFSKTTKNALAATSIKSQRKSTAESIASFDQQRKSGGKIDDLNPLASIIQDLEDKASNMEESEYEKHMFAVSGQKTNRQVMMGKAAALKKRFLAADLDDQLALRRIGEDTSELLAGLQDGQFVGKSGNVMSVPKKFSGSARIAGGILDPEYILSKESAGELGRIVKGGRKFPKHLQAAVRLDSINKRKNLGLADLTNIANRKEYNQNITEIYYNKNFSDLQFVSFWRNFGEEIANAETIKFLETPRWQRKTYLAFEDNPFFIEFAKRIGLKYDRRDFSQGMQGLDKNLKSLGMPGLLNKDPNEGVPYPMRTDFNMATANDQGMTPVDDISWFGKFAAMTPFADIINKLMYSVSDPVVLGESDKNFVETVQASNAVYKQSPDLSKSRINKGLSKKKVEEVNEKMCLLKEEITNKTKDVDVNMIFDSTLIRKLGIALAQNNLVSILSMPQFTEGVKSLVETATGDRSLNTGSHGTPASSSLIDK